MLGVRVIPCLQLIGDSLVKTTQFKTHSYIGDPRNTVTIFNDLEADELVFLDIRASVEGRPPNKSILRDIANQAFMPLCYGGGISSLDQARAVFSIGFEKIILGTSAFASPGLVTEIASAFGSQSLIAAVDVKKTLFGGYRVFTHSARKDTKVDPITYVKRMQDEGIGEIMLTSIDREGTWQGYDGALVAQVQEVATVPLIANGGASGLTDMQNVVKNTGVQAVAAGSLFVYQKKDLGVLINYPSRPTLEQLFA